MNVDTTAPNAARRYDLFNGGKDNFEVDRQVCAALGQFAPAWPLLYREERRCEQRMLRFLAGPAGIDQFVVCGAGFPWPGMDVHDLVFQVNPEAAVVYVEDDPVAVAFCRLDREDMDHTLTVEASFTEPKALFARADVAQFIDLDRPIGLLQMNTLQAVEDTDTAATIMADYIAAMVPGSYVALSHVYSPRDDEALATLASKIRGVVHSPWTPTTFRNTDEITSLLPGLTILDPAQDFHHRRKFKGPLVPPTCWWQDGPIMLAVEFELALMRVALARKDTAVPLVT